MKSKVDVNKLKFAILAVDAVCVRMINGKVNILLGEVNAGNFYKNKSGVIGGLVAPGETAEEAIKRHLLSKAGIKEIYCEQLSTFSAINRDPRGRVVSIAYLCLTNTDSRINVGSIKTIWKPISKVGKLAYDHNEIIDVAIGRLRAKLRYTNISQFLLPKEFTLTELQDLYQNVLNIELDKRNFRKKILSLKIIKAVGRIDKRGASRPAALYKFINNRIQIKEII